MCGCFRAFPTTHLTGRNLEPSYTGCRWTTSPCGRFPARPSLSTRHGWGRSHKRTCTRKSTAAAFPDDPSQWTEFGTQLHWMSLDYFAMRPLPGKTITIDASRLGSHGEV